MAQLSCYVGTARRSRHHQPQIRVRPGSCRHGSVRWGQCIRGLYHCVYRNWLAMADAPWPPLVAPLRYLFTVRSQQAVLFAIFITFVAEIIALLRNPERWIGNHFAEWLFALVVALTVVTVATLVLILVTQRNRISLSSLRWTRTILPVVIAIVVLTVCPEWPIDSPSRTAHILTVALGALVVFIPMRLLLPEIVLNGSDGHRETTTFGTAREWTLLLVGVAVVLFGFFRHIPILVSASPPFHRLRAPGSTSGVCRKPKECN